MFLSRYTCNLLVSPAAANQENSNTVMNQIHSQASDISTTGQVLEVGNHVLCHSAVQCSTQDQQVFMQCSS